MDGTLNIWNLNTGIIENRILGIKPNINFKCKIYTSEDGHVIFKTDNIEIYNIKNGNIKIIKTSPYCNIIVSKNEIIHGNCGNLEIYNLKTNKQKRIPNLEPDNNYKKIINLLPNGEILTLTWNHYLSKINVNTQEYLPKKFFDISELEVLSDGRLVIICNSNLEIWN